MYKGVTKKVLLLAWACIFSLAACLFLAFMWDRIFWAGVALSLGLYAAVGAKRLRCPHCGSYLGRNTGPYCPECGKEVDRTEK